VLENELVKSTSYIMPLIGFLIRLAGGERFRKSTPAERRWYGAYFLFVPIVMYSFVHFGHGFLNRAGTVAIWVAFTAVFAGAFFGVTTCAKHIPARVSLILGIVVWAVTLWLALTNRLF